jgi:putative transcriptional regulator
MVALIGWSIAIGNAVVPIPAAIGGAVLLYLLRRQVSDVIEDERNYRISEKASRFAIQVFAIITAITGITLTAVSTDNHSPFREVGLTLAFCACGLLILYMISYTYHNRKS